jgi:hypothetical protein
MSAKDQASLRHTAQAIAARRRVRLRSILRRLPKVRTRRFGSTVANAHADLGLRTAQARALQTTRKK